MHTNRGIAHFDNGGRPRDQAPQKTNHMVEMEQKQAAWDAKNDALLKQYKGKVPLDIAIKQATEYKGLADAMGNSGRGNGRDAGPRYNLSDSTAVSDTFRKLGLDPAIAPARVDLGLYAMLQGKAGGKLDPKAAFANSQFYEDGRSMTNDTRIPDMMAQGISQGKTGKDLWKPIEAWNDSQRGKNQGWGAVENFATGMAHSIAENPLAGAAISAAAGAMGVPPNVTMALLAANRGGVKGDWEGALKGMALDYVGGKAGEFAGGAAKGALEGSGLGSTATKGITNIATGAGRQLATTGKVDLAGLTKGAVTGGLKDYAGGAISDFAAANGLDSLNIEGLNIPGLPSGLKLPDLKGNLIEGVSAGNANTAMNLIGKTPIGKGSKVISAIKTLQKPTLGGINNLINPPAPRARPTASVRPPPPPRATTTAPAPAAGGPPPAVLAALNKPKPPGG